MKVLLVSMPWQMVDSPPLPIGLLTASVHRSRPGVEVEEYHANIDWCDYLLDRDSAITIADYSHVAEVGVWHAVGDWVFAGALYDDPEWRCDVFADYLRQHNAGTGPWSTMRALTFPWLEHALRVVLDSGADVVGFSTTFSQNAASLALARRIKRHRPDVRVVFGGSNCDGPMGAALHRNFDFVDYVVSGEGEVALVSLLDAVEAGEEPVAVPGLCWRDASGAQRVNAPGPMVPMDAVPRPDYTGWVEALQGSQVEREVVPQLVLEAARGCWWGGKHHCTFCGLNGTTMAFRAKPAATFVDDLAELVRRHRILDVVMVDNIMDHAYFGDLLPRLAALDCDLRLRWEVKANLRRDQLAALASAGVRHIQPGIESLSTRVLRIMDKGVHATQNVQLLRDCSDLAVTVDWNLLYGFPQEDERDYRDVIVQLPALVHLQPPAAAVRLLLERFSPYFDRPELGFLDRAPSAQYDHVYDLTRQELADLAYQFDSPAQGIAGDTEAALLAHVSRWKRDNESSALVARRDGDTLRVVDRRAGWPRRVHDLSDPLDAALYDVLQVGRSVSSLAGSVSERLASGVSTLDVEGRLRWLQQHGLVFVEGGRAVALATRELPPLLSTFASSGGYDVVGADDALVARMSAPAAMS